MTKEAEFDEKEGKFYLLCDNPECHKTRMVPKEGRKLGIEAIRDRLVSDGQLLEQAFSLYGVPKVLLGNSVPVSIANQTVDDYEITPGYVLEWDRKTRKVLIKKEPWIVKDDQGIDSYSMLPHATPTDSGFDD